ncbi:MAG: protein kinase [candidate division WOR-3 bacterium]|nr:protein kinase [candidate division WOR-3 bacterium]
MVNRRIRNFEIKELIATGGMAAIYKAIHVTLDRVVAVKILHGHLAQDKDFIIRFEREAKAAANLQHENIVNIIDFGQEEEVYFIAMEYVDGKSLKDLLNQVKFIPQEITLAIVREIAKGLGYAHQKGIVHRDMKPANILIGYDGSVKIADFGLAQAQDLTSITVTGAIVGTPAYMSPEQAAGKKVDNRSDIFSLGVMFYEMLTGEKPFKGENYSAVIHEILTVTPPSPIEANPLISRDISTIIEKMLEKDPDKRYQSIEEVGEDITIKARRNRIETGRKEIGEFVKAPEQAMESLLQKRKQYHYERGIYYMNLGYEKIDDAIVEFEKVLLIDPNEIKAKEYLEKLKKKKERMPEEKRPVEKAGVRKFSISITHAFAGLFVLAIILFALIRFLSTTKSGSLSPTHLTGTVVVNSFPSGARIIFDGDSTDRFTPAVFEGLKTGEHRIELKKEGYKSYVQNFEIKGNDTVNINVELISEVVKKDTPQVAKPPPPKKPSTIVEGTSFLKVKVDPWAKIYIDGSYVETTPIAKNIELSSGVHNVRLENPNFKTWQRNIKFKPGETVELNVRLEPHEGFLKLVVKPWADVYIDGKFYETTPIGQPIRLSAGQHTLKLINPLCKPYEEVILIKPNQVLKRDIELQRK